MTRSYKLFRGSVLAVAIAAVAGESAALAGLPPHANAARQNSISASGPPVTFNRDIAAIVFHYCASCHRPGEAGPFPLLTYEDVKKHGNQIAAVTTTRFMPPWLPEPQPLKFADERRLSAEQIALIQKWVEQGMIQGSLADLPPQPQFVKGWQLGKPDLVVKAAKPFQLPASGIDTYWNFILPIPINESRWVKAVEIRPGDKRLVHHANILVDRLELSRKMETEPGVGFGGMEIRIESELFDPDSHFLFWKPGTVPYVEPDGMALRLDKGTDLVLNTHLQPSGKPEMIEPSIGIYFTDKPATEHPMLLQLECDSQLDIPPGDANFVVHDEFTLPLDVDVLAIYPHAHYLGKHLEATATLPDGTQETLIDIKHWDLNWQAVYRYAQPVPLPKGTTISMRYVYDNSEQNVANPNHPPKRVKGGNRSSDEMAHLWLQVLPKSLPDSNRDPRMVLQEALALHHVERDPADFEGHYNLGAMLQERGDVHGSRDAISSRAAAASGRSGGEQCAGRRVAGLRRLGRSRRSSFGFAEGASRLLRRALQPGERDGLAGQLQRRCGTVSRCGPPESAGRRCGGQLGQRPGANGRTERSQIALRTSTSIKARPRPGAGESATRRADVGARA